MIRSATIRWSDYYGSGSRVARRRMRPLRSDELPRLPVTFIVPLELEVALSIAGPNRGRFLPLSLRTGGRSAWQLYERLRSSAQPDADDAIRLQLLVALHHLGQTLQGAGSTRPTAPSRSWPEPSAHPTPRALVDYWEKAIIEESRAAPRVQAAARVLDPINPERDRRTAAGLYLLLDGSGLHSRPGNTTL
jgi:hypothetical protein